MWKRLKPVGAFTRRATDRVEDAVAWLLTALGMFALLGAVAAGASVYSASVERNRLESADIGRFDAVLLEAVPTELHGPALGMHPLPTVRARYVDRQGVEHLTTVSVRGGVEAGATVPVWLDPNGDVVPDPTGSRALIAGAFVGVTIASLTSLFLILAWLALRVVVGRVNAAAWGREWERLEPQWTGRIPGHRSGQEPEAEAV